MAEATTLSMATSQVGLVATGCGVRTGVVLEGALQRIDLLVQAPGSLRDVG